MNAVANLHRSPLSLIAEMPILEREIALMEKAIAVHDRHAELMREMQARGLTLMNSAVFMHEIADVVAVKHGLTRADLIGPSMLKPIVLARQEAMWELANRQRSEGQNRWSRSQIGRFFHRDHTTVIHGIRRHAARLAAEVAG